MGCLAKYVRKAMLLVSSLDSAVANTVYVESECHGRLNCELEREAQAVICAVRRRLVDIPLVLRYHAEIDQDRSYLLHTLHVLSA